MNLSPYLVNQINAVEIVDGVLSTEVIEAHGGRQLEAIATRTLKTGVNEKRPPRAMFVFIRAMPYTDFLEGTV